MTKSASLIDKFVCLVNDRDYPSAFNRLLELLVVIDTSGNRFSENEYFDTPDQVQTNATLISSALLTLLTAKKLKMDWHKYLKLIIHKKTITSLFRVSGFGGTNYATHYFLNKYETTNNQKEKTTYLYKMLLVMGLAEHTPESLTMLMEVDTKISTPYILSLLSSHVIMSEKEHLIREKLLAFGPIISQQPADFDISGIFAVAWMHCSYAVRDDKHIFKGYLNKMMKQAMEKSGFAQPKIKNIDYKIKRPRILVLAEILTSTHAMGRCFTNYVIQLKRDFEMILITSDDAVDEITRKHFDHSKIFSFKDHSIHQIAQLISEQQPDMVYYPSIGMATWTIALLTFRFAPIQIATSGHPATTIADTIDYLLAPEFLLSNPELYSERLLTLGNELDNTHASRIDEQFPSAIINKNPDILRIAVNGKSVKINPEFLSACQHINSIVTRPIEWIFFPNEIGLQYYHCQLEIQQWLINSQVIKSMPYNDYLDILNQCDMAVSPFPFGGSNSNIDLLRLGIPLVYLTGQEIHARTDEFYFRYFDLCEDLACDNLEEFCQSVKSIVDDDQKRFDLSQKILKKDPNVLLITDEIDNKTDVVDTFNWVWKNHPSVIEQDLRIMHTQDRKKPLTVTNTSLTSAVSS